ncbi:MAG: hypothetical protein V3U56_05595, partial [Syntrophobacteria bacterium]
HRVKRDERDEKSGETGKDDRGQIQSDAETRGHGDAARQGKKTEVGGQKSEIRGLRAVSLSVISYSLFVRSVVMNCLDDLKDFYDLPLTAYQELPADTTGETVLNVLLFPPQQQSH